MAVPELLKISEKLFKAKKTTESDADFEYGSELDISSKKNEMTEIKNLSNEIVDLGLNLLDLLDREKGLKQSREDAIKYLDSISKDSDINKDGEIDKKIMQILNNQEKALEQLDIHVNELKQKQTELNNDVQMKKLELERAEKRLENLKHASPGHQNEIMQYENDLATIYKIYVEKIRNQSYLENKVSNFQKYEEAGKNNLKNIIEKNKALEQELIHDENDKVEIEGRGEDDEQNGMQDGVQLEGMEQDEDIDEEDGNF
jgi:chromosome segregation ATPase